MITYADDPAQPLDVYALRDDQAAIIQADAATGSWTDGGYGVLTGGLFDDIAYDSGQGQLYGTASGGGSLWLINGPASLTQVGAFGGAFQEIAIDETSGQMFGTNLDGNRLYAINKAYATWTEIAASVAEGPGVPGVPTTVPTAPPTPEGEAAARSRMTHHFPAELGAGAVIANAITDLGTGSFLGTLDFAGGGLARTSTAGGSTLGTLQAGSDGGGVSLNPAIAWLAQTSETASDIMQLTNTSGTAQVLSLTYDPGLAPPSPQDAFLGWFDTGTWVNAIDGNGSGSGSFFQGSWSDYLVANPLATPTSVLGVYGHDSTSNTVWAVIDHNSDFAVIIVPEPGTFVLAGLVVGLASVVGLRRLPRPA